MDVSARPGQPILPFEAIPEVAFPPDYPTSLPTFWAQLATAQGPIFRRRLPPGMAQHLGTDWVVYLIGPEANRFVLHTQREAFSHDRGWTPQIGEVFDRGLLNTDDPAHAAQRRMMNPAFAIAYMHRYLPLMRQVIAEYTADWVARGTVDIYDEMRKITFGIAAEALVGIHTGARADRLRTLFYTLLYGEFTEETLGDFMATREELRRLILSIIAERRQHPTDDILGILVQARDEDGQVFTDEEIIGQVEILLVAGHETTTTLSSWVLMQLASSPAYRAIIRAEIATALSHHGGALTLDAVREMATLSRCIDETGRLYSPVGLVPRGVVRAVDFAGYHIPAGTQLRLVLAGGHRLPRVFADPERFDPERFAPPRDEEKQTPYSLVTFGGGQRICIGINFAQIEVKALVALLLPQFDLIPDHLHPPIHAYFGLTATIPGGMPMQVVPVKAEL